MQVLHFNNVDRAILFICYFTCCEHLHSDYTSIWQPPLLSKRIRASPARWLMTRWTVYGYTESQTYLIFFWFKSSTKHVVVVKKNCTYELEKLMENKAKLR